MSEVREEKILKQQHTITYFFLVGRSLVLIANTEEFRKEEKNQLSYIWSPLATNKWTNIKYTW